jgi:peptidyl-prolyl cis-trans isomerase B (cyclophilin B)
MLRWAAPLDSAAMGRPAVTIVVVCAFAITLPSCGGGDGDEPATAPGCERVDAPAPKRVLLQPPPLLIRPGQRLAVTVDTSCGSFEVALNTSASPKTTNSFAYLVRSGFYDGLSFNYIKPAFIQGGDPKGDRTGGPGYFVDEPPPPNLAYTRGIVAMAKTQVEPPGRSASQFFVVTAADAGLSPDYALLGRVTGGMDVVERIDELGTPSGRPRQAVLIDRIRLSRR